MTNLKDAIKTLLAHAQPDPDHSNFMIVRTEDLADLLIEYNEYFVENEDDDNA